jgi:hydroxymethylbilane synthase
LDEGEYDAVVLAVAGLVRLELSGRITAVLDPKRILGAVGGAALGLECREDDRSTAGRLEAISHRETWLAVTAERAMLSRLRAGCHAPVGAQTGLAGGRLWLSGVVLDARGTRRVEARLETDVALGDGSAAFGEIQGVAGRLGEAVADELLAAGAAELISG